ncbi:IclR family transcriptional regulator [Acidisphaera sp. S103]|uniref:IclR family transcriptional regulator n=1 Tax=Acidisphaera sp. S103 TaxID=1747223 RepID=UPI00131A8275|nr:IclR family transcriptional regulator [Acidisphaera sp. S103]
MNIDARHKTAADLKPAKKAPRIRQVPALTRGIAILRLLGRTDEPLGVQAIARALGLVPSTCLHILRVLADENLVTADPVSKKYAVASGLVALARSALRQHTFPAVVQPDLDELAQRYGATAIGVEASGLEHMIVVAMARSDSPLRVHVDIGSRFPALISATGRCVAAFGTYPWAEIQAHFTKLRWDNPPTLAAWRKEVHAVRDAGYAVDDGRYIRGVSIVAAPVRMPNGSINALVVVGVSEQMRRVGLTTVGEDLRTRAIRVSRALGGETLTGG